MEKKGLLRRNETYSSIFIFILFFYVYWFAEPRKFIC